MDDDDDDDVLMIILWMMMMMMMLLWKNMIQSVGGTRNLEHEFSSTDSVFCAC